MDLVSFSINEIYIDWMTKRKLKGLRNFINELVNKLKNKQYELINENVTITNT